MRRRRYCRIDGSVDWREREIMVQFASLHPACALCVRSAADGTTCLFPKYHRSSPSTRTQTCSASSSAHALEVLGSTSLLQTRSFSLTRIG